MEDDFVSPAVQPPLGDRPPRIPLKAIENINQAAKIPIFYKAKSNSATIPLINKFPKEALAVFSNIAKRELQNGGKSFTFVGGDQNAIKDVLNWIIVCIGEGKAAMFQSYDDSDPNLFLKYARAIETADHLGVPTRDFSEGLKKRMIGIARKTRMSWDLVEQFYIDYPEKDDLRAVAAASVFFAWWRGDLDEETTPDEMCFLSVLREENPELDEDLHEWAAKNEADIRAKWQKKDEEKRAAASGPGFDDTGFGGNSGGGEGWDEQVGSRATGDWEHAGGGGAGWDPPAAASSGNEWEKENVAPVGESSGWDTPVPTPSGASGEDVGGHSDSWADEVNDAQKPVSAW